jgi:S-adenosylmethionine hydrolase
MRRDDLVRLPDIYPRIDEDGQIHGRVVTIDRFGNGITNISLTCLQNQFPEEFPERLDILVGGTKLSGMEECYGLVGIGRPLALIGSRGYLEVAVNSGNAADILGLKKNIPVRVAVSSI